MADDIEKQKAEEAAKAEAEAKAKAEAEAKEKGSSQEGQTDYKALAESNETLAKAEKARADAAEALIIKNKEISRRNKDGGGDGGEAPVTRKDLEDLKATILSAKSAEDSPEEKALKEASANLEKVRTQNAELARALKSKATVNTNAAGTHGDAMLGDKPKLSIADEKAMKEAGYEWDNAGRVFKKKLGKGKFLYAKDMKSPTWIGS